MEQQEDKTMPRPLNLVAFCGSANRPSKTRSLIVSILERVSPHIQTRNSIYDLQDFDGIGFSYGRGALPVSVQRILDEIENADILIVGSPVMKGSYAGLFKHVFDLINPDKLLDKPVLICACGGGYRHALVVEHQLRPLFAFFGALTLPIGIYASEKDFDNGILANPDIHDRIDLAVRGLAQIVMPSERLEEA
jgi:FMN reductase